MFGLSLDSPWSHRAWAESLMLGDAVTLLSDRLGDAARGCGVLGEWSGMPKAERSTFLVESGVVRRAWLLGSELPDIDAIISAASV